MKHLFRLCILMIFYLVSAIAADAQTDKPILAIKTFDNPTTESNSTIGNAVTDILFTELGRRGRFQLVERSAFNEIAKEIDFGSSDWVKKSAAAGKGGMAGANFILIGKVTNFSFNETQFTEQVQTSTGMAQQTMYRQNAAVRLDFRIVSVVSGIAIVTESGGDSQENVSTTSERATFARLMRVGSFTAEAQSSLIGRTTIGAIQNAVQKISDLSEELNRHLSDEARTARMSTLSGVSGHVTGVTAGAVFVNLGTPDHSLQKGDRLNVFEEEVTKNQKGDVIFTEYKSVAVLQILALDGQNAKAQLMANPVPGGRDPREGDIVRAAAERAATDAPASRGGNANTMGVSPEGNAAEFARLVRQADRYVDDKYFAQAVDTYRKCLVIQPNNPAVMTKLYKALLRNKQLTEAQELMYPLFSSVGGVSFRAVHNHAFGNCNGVLFILNGKITFASDDKDHSFTATAQDIVSLAEDWIGTIPVLRIRFRDNQGREKKYDIWVTTYVTSYTSTEIKGDDEDVVSYTGKLHRILIRLAQDKVFIR